MTLIKICQVLILQFSRIIDMVKATIFQVEIILINFTSHLLVNLMPRREKNVYNFRSFKVIPGECPAYFIDALKDYIRFRITLYTLGLEGFSNDLYH